MKYESLAGGLRGMCLLSLCDIRQPTRAGWEPKELLVKLRLDQLVVGTRTRRAQLGISHELVDDLLAGNVLLLRHALVDRGSNFHLRWHLRFLLGSGR